MIYINVYMKKINFKISILGQFLVEVVYLLLANPNKKCILYFGVVSSRIKLEKILRC